MARTSVAAMLIYDPDRHETLVVDWFLRQLRGHPEELENLFASPLRSLTEILGWAKHTVKIMFEMDNGGIWIASWVEPVLSGAYYGLWVRQDKRQTKGMLKHVDEVLDYSLTQFPVLMAITKQARLQDEMERLGFVKQGDIPFLFDGHDAGIYFLTKESRDGRKWRRQDLKSKLAESLRASVGEVREPIVQERPADSGPAVQPDGGGPPDGRGEQPYPPRKRKRRNGKASVQHELPEPEESIGTIGSFEQQLRPTDFGTGADAGGAGDSEHPLPND